MDCSAVDTVLDQIIITSTNRLSSLTGFFNDGYAEDFDVSSNHTNLLAILGAFALRYSTSFFGAFLSQRTLAGCYPSLSILPKWQKWLARQVPKYIKKWNIFIWTLRQIEYFSTWFPTAKRCLNYIQSFPSSHMCTRWLSLRSKQVPLRRKTQIMMMTGHEMTTYAAYTVFEARFKNTQARNFAHTLHVETSFS